MQHLTMLLRLRGVDLVDAMHLLGNVWYSCLLC